MTDRPLSMREREAIGKILFALSQHVERLIEANLLYLTGQTSKTRSMLEAISILESSERNIRELKKDIQILTQMLKQETTE